MYRFNLTAWKTWRGSSTNQRSQFLALTIKPWLVGGVLLLLMLLVVVPVEAQTPTQPLRVVTRIVPPFVFEENGELVGFSIDLWRSVADELGVKFELIVKPTVAALLSAVKSNQADLGIAAISITAGREKEFDFSYPILESGLQILVQEQSSSIASVFSLFAVIFSPAFLQLIGIILVLILVPAHIIWLYERRHDRGIISSKSYFPGIFQACWWAAATLAAQADEMPKGAIGRTIALVWMFVSVVFLAYFTAAVTTSLTVQQLQGNIKGPDDLPGKVVATTASSTSAAYLRQQKIQVLEFAQIDQAYDALIEKRADAVVFDAPVLQYYASRQGKGKVQVVGNLFRKESYGIVLPTNSSYRKLINNVLLTLQENGTYQQLYDKWFISGSS